MTFVIPIGTATLTTTYRYKSDNSLFDPQQPQFLVVSPSGKRSIVALTNQSTGIYVGSFDFNAVGNWQAIPESLAAGELLQPAPYTITVTKS